jgi:transposase
MIHRIHAVFRQHGLRVSTKPGSPQRVPLRLLPRTPAREVVRANLRQLELATAVKAEARVKILELARTFPAFELLQTIPYIGELRAAELIAIIETPNRFSSRRHFWAYAGLAVVQHVSADRVSEDSVKRREPRSRGYHLNAACQPRLRRLLRELAVHASLGNGPFRQIYNRHIARGKRPTVARIALARRIGSILLAVWRSEKPFSARTLKLQKPRQSRGEHRRASSVLTANRSQRPAANHMPPRAVISQEHQTG